VVPSKGLGIDSILLRQLTMGFQQLTFWGYFGLIDCGRKGQSP